MSRAANKQQQNLVTKTRTIVLQINKLIKKNHLGFLAQESLGQLNNAADRPEHNSAKLPVM